MIISMNIVGLQLLVWSELGWSRPFQPMRDLKMKWSRAFSLVWEVALRGAHLPTLVKLPSCWYAFAPALLKKTVERLEGIHATWWISLLQTCELWCTKDTGSMFNLMCTQIWNSDCELWPRVSCPQSAVGMLMDWCWIASFSASMVTRITM